MPFCREPWYLRLCMRLAVHAHLPMHQGTLMILGVACQAYFRRRSDAARVRPMLPLVLPLVDSPGTRRIYSTRNTEILDCAQIGARSAGSQPGGCYRDLT